MATRAGRCTCCPATAAEIVSVSFDSQSQLVLTGSFDHTCRVYDVRTGDCVRLLVGTQRGGVRLLVQLRLVNAVLSSSIDRTCKLYSLDSGQARC